MKKILLAAAGVAALVAVVFVVSCISVSNKEQRLRNSIDGKVKANMAELDNCTKQISQVTQVAKFDRESLAKLFVEHAEARSTGGENMIMTWVKESVPSVDASTMKQLVNIISATRNKWTMRQTEIAQLGVEHENARLLWPGTETFPFSMFVGGKEKIDIKIVTSTRTEKAFETGKDDDIDLGL